MENVGLLQKAEYFAGKRCRKKSSKVVEIFVSALLEAQEMPTPQLKSAKTKKQGAGLGAVRNQKKKDVSQ